MHRTPLLPFASSGNDGSAPASLSQTRLASAKRFAIIKLLALPEPKARVQELFNRIALPYARRILPRARAETRQDVAWLQPQGYEQALDVACGPGTLSLALASRSRTLYGLDLAEGMIAQARRAARLQRCANAHFAVGEGERLPLPDDCFDLVTCSYSFASFPAPQKIVQEMRRVTRPGGRLGIVEAVAPEEESRRRRLNRLEELRSRAPTRLLSLKDLVALLTQANLQLVDCHVEERPRQLDDWLALSEPGTHRRGRRQLREEMLRAAENDDLGLHLSRQGGRWIFYHTVARLLWQK